MSWKTGVVASLCWTVVCARGAAAAGPEHQRRGATPPNIVLIMTDDQGYGDLGIHGNTILETPNIDALARKGASVRRFYVSPVCTPTRASLLTGRYNYRTRAIDTYRGRAMMEPDEVTLAEMLNANGYRTGIFGKWHLGDCYPMRPGDQGFSESLVHRGGGLAQPSEPIENQRRYTDPVLLRNGEKIQTKGYCTDVYFDAAIEFIGQARGEQRPFFAYIAPNAPHDPFHDVPADLYDQYKSRDLSSLLPSDAKHADQVARIFAMIENIDANVGRLDAALTRLGLANDTIIVYLHDNGPHLARFTAGLRAGKSQVYEGGIRSPLFVRWDGRIRPGTVVQQVGAHIDITPTLLEAAGVEPPTGVRFDGRSLLPLLRGKDVPWADRWIMIQSHRGDVPARLHQFAVIGSRWKLLRASGFGRERPPEDAPFELYDLVNDPGEQHDLSDLRPPLVDMLKSVYERWFDAVSSTRPDNYAPPRIRLGPRGSRVTVLTRQDWRPDEGPGWGRAGRWLLAIDNEHPYTIRVLVRDTLPRARVTVRVGSEDHTVTATKPSSKFELRDVRFKPGPTELKVLIDSEGKALAPYHVFLVRQ